MGWRKSQTWIKLWHEEPVLFFLTWAVLLSTIIQIVLVFFHITDVAADGSLRKTLMTHFRLMGKQGIYGIFVILAFIEGRRRGWSLESGLNLICILLGLLTIYVFAQRYTGINWVHGFSSDLPPHRLAYGVYRISGLMGHPLSFAYNLMLFTLFCFGFSISSQIAAGLRWKWIACTAMSFSCLLLSGSRWPLVVAIVLMVPIAARLMIRSRLFWLSSLLIIVWFSAFDRGTINRFGEIFESKQTWEERMPRLVFWKVHLAMFQGKPIAGTGYANRGKVRLDYYVQEGYTELREKYSAHNIFLQTLADSGVIGFLSLLCLLAGVMAAGFVVWRRDHSSSLFLVGAATLLAGLMQNNLRDSEYLFALWAFFAWYVAIRKEKAFDSGSEVQNNHRRAGCPDYQPDVRR